MPAFITFEDIDGSGKSSIVTRIAEIIRSADVAVWTTAEPTGSWLGKAVKESHRNASFPEVEALLFVADRTEHQQAIGEHLARGAHVLCDRYRDSTIAYQSVMLE